MPTTKEKFFESDPCSVCEDVGEYAYDQQGAEGVSDRSGGGRRVGVRLVNRDSNRSRRLFGVAD